MERRDFLRYIAGMMAGTSLSLHLSPSLSAQMATPPINQTKRKLLILVAQGGLDGMALLPPYGDPDYADLRGGLALIDEQGAIMGQKLDDLFALHPAMLASLWPLWRQQELIFFPALGTSYIGDRHDEARDALLKAGASNYDHAVNWLERAITVSKGEHLNNIESEFIESSPSQPPLYFDPRFIGTGRNIPEANQLLGTRKQKSEQATLASYENDAALYQALDNVIGDRYRKIRRYGVDHDMEFETILDVHLLPDVITSLTGYMASANGPDHALVSFGGFDSHINQGRIEGRLAMSFAALGDAINRARQQLQDHWQDSLILVVSEFGRSIRPNGFLGTDHGMASLGMMIGGAVNGGQIIGDWPGLAHSLNEGMNGLQPSIDMRALYKAILSRQFDMNQQGLNDIFENSLDIPMLNGLFMPS